MKYKARLIKIIIPFYLALTTLAACGPTPADTIFTKGLIYCSEGSPSSFNPQLITDGTTTDATTQQLYNRLINFDNDNLERIPGLAKSWHVTRNGKMITFYLRKDVSFHQTDYFTPTRKMNADDVIFSFNRLIDPTDPFYQVVDGNFPFFKSINFAELVDEIEKIDDYTVRFKISHPDSTFLSNLATPFAVILSKEYSEQLMAADTLQNIDNLPIGTGPFKFKEYRNNAIIRYSKHPEYWRQDVAIEQLIFNITPNKTNRLTKLFTHECDVISYPIAQQEIRSRDDLMIDEVTAFNVAFFAFNTQVAPFDNPSVRKAIAHAINKEAIIKSVYYGQAEAADSMLPRLSWAYSNKISSIPYSIKMAKQLLADAGLGDGFSFDIWAPSVQRSYNPNSLKMAKLIKADLAEVGIDANIISYEWTTFLRKIEKGEHQSVLIGWNADHPDPDNFFSPLLSCSAMATGRNRAFWCNQQFDQLLAKSLLTNDLTERFNFYHAAQQILVDQVPLIPIAHSKRSLAKLKNVKGDILPPFGGVSFENVHKVDGSKM